MCCSETNLAILNIQISQILIFLKDTSAEIHTKNERVTVTYENLMKTFIWSVDCSQENVSILKTLQFSISHLRSVEHSQEKK